MITSAAIAVTLSAHHQKQRGATIGFAISSVLFLYTTIVNVIERPDGIKIAGLFILGIITVSFVSRIARSTELRATSVRFTPEAVSFMKSVPGGVVRLVAHEPNDTGVDRYRTKLASARAAHHMTDDEVFFIEVVKSDSSDFEGELIVRGIHKHEFRVLTVRASSVSNAIAAVSLFIESEYRLTPHIYFRWTEKNPLINLIRFFLFGEGEIASMTREVLREAEPDPMKRPWIHVA